MERRHCTVPSLMTRQPHQLTSKSDKLHPVDETLHRNTATTTPPGGHLRGGRVCTFLASDDPCMAAQTPPAVQRMCHVSGPLFAQLRVQFRNLFSSRLEIYAQNVSASTGLHVPDRIALDPLEDLHSQDILILSVSHPLAMKCNNKNTGLTTTKSTEESWI